MFLKYIVLSSLCVWQVRATCGDPPVVEGADDISGGTYSEGEEITYQCNGCHTYASGRKIYTCSSGDWTPTNNLVCNPINCGYPTLDSFAQIQGNDFTCPNTVTITCITGYYLDPPDSGLRRCQVNGAWSGSESECKRVKCPELTDPTHGGYSYSRMDRDYGSTASLHCNTNYMVIGNGNSHDRTCEGSGHWSGPDLTCEPLQCIMPTIQNADITGSNLAGDAITIQCDQGFRPFGGLNEIFCVSYGDNSAIWDADTPTCYSDCGNPSGLENGIFDPNSQEYRHQSDITYSCNNGYSITGPERYSCNNGTWEPQFPAHCCKNCPALSVLNANEHTTTIGTCSKKKLFQCKSNYDSKGTCEFTCTDGVWSPVENDCTCVLITTTPAPTTTPTTTTSTTTSTTTTTPALSTKCSTDIPYNKGEKVKIILWVSFVALFVVLLLVVVGILYKRKYFRKWFGGSANLPPAPASEPLNKPVKV